MTMSDQGMPAMTPWQARAYQRAGAALDSGRMGHALLITGPAMLGKRVVAERLAQRVLCTQRQSDDQPCRQCRSCKLFQARAQNDPLEVRPDGSPAHPHGHPGHPDVYFIGYAINPRTGKPRTEIVIEQIRALSEKLSLTPQYDGAQIGIVEPADAMNRSAGNALLKTLEEPQPGRYLWLVTSDPSRLPATIRSRCQSLEMQLPPRAEALAWLLAQGHEPDVATEALDAAGGHPGLAETWLGDGGLVVQREVAADLDKLASGMASPAATAQRWVADPRAALRLRFAAEQALREAGGACGSLAASSGLTDPARTRRLAAWFDAANRTRALLRTTVRADLAVAELLLAWQADAIAGGQRGRR